MQLQLKRKRAAQKKKSHRTIFEEFQRKARGPKQQLDKKLVFYAGDCHFGQIAVPFKRQGTKIKGVHSPTRLCIEHRMIGILLASAAFADCAPMARIYQHLRVYANAAELRRTG